MYKKAILAELKRLYPDAGPELHFTNPYETLVATMLSAQCTDKQVNKVTPEVFARYPDATAMAACTAEELYPLVAPFGVARPALRQHRQRLPDDCGKARRPGAFHHGGAHRPARRGA